MNRFDSQPDYMKEVLFTPSGVAKRREALGPACPKISQVEMSDEARVIICRVFSFHQSLSALAMMSFIRSTGNEVPCILRHLRPAVQPPAMGVEMGGLFHLWKHGCRSLSPWFWLSGKVAAHFFVTCTLVQFSALFRLSIGSL